MTLYQQNSSDVFSRFFQPVVTAYSSSNNQYLCHELSDLEFLELGVLRTISDSKTGRDFLQRHGDFGCKQVGVDLFFKALKSSRRLRNTSSVNRRLAPVMAQRCSDPLASIPELKNFGVYAGDGHFHAAAAHDRKYFTEGDKQKKYSVGHFFVLNLRSHYLSHLTIAEQNKQRRREHDMRAIKRQEIDALRQGEPKGRKVIMVWDKAGIDFGFWEKVKKRAGLYFISLEKENMKLTKCGLNPVDQSDERNDGVISDEFVGPSGAGAMFRRITYEDPVEKKIYVYLTTEMTLPPGIIALLYKQRWDIEKVFDELKSKLYEKKAWASSAAAKSQQAQFLCLTHNLLMMLEQVLEDADVTNDKEIRRKERREEKALGKGGNFVAMALSRFKVRSLKLIRWVRNFAYQTVPWRQAVDRLRHIYATF